MMAANGDSSARERAVRAAKAQIGRSARLIGQEDVQLHGGIGTTTTAGQYFERPTLIKTMLEDADHPSNRLAADGRAL